MRFLDLLRMSSSSLWKRKVRTMLTVLGVVIGTASIVVMISLGLGLNRSSMEMIEQYGGLTTIEVTESGGGGNFGNMSMAVMGGAQEEKKQEIKHMDDKLVETIQGLENVTDVYPVIMTSAIAKNGVFENYLNLQGMSKEALEKLNIPLEKGKLPTGENGKIEFLYGNMVMQGFSNSKTNKGYWETGVLPDIDLVEDPMFVIFDIDSYNQGKWGNEAEPKTPIIKAKKYVVNGCGLVAGGIEEYNNHSWNVYCEIDSLKAQLKKIFKNRAIPGQPTQPSGKPYKEIYYNTIKVNVDDMANMASVQQQIIDMGYQANSNAEWIDSQKKQAGYMQAVLGGIGAVSLFVAAIGITNTMMMSIYERTKEIGIMKVLGCDMRNIRTQFLMEAGYIGFIGGIVGLILSFGISLLINTLVASSDLGTKSLSYIPAWLALLSVAFAVGVGMVAGFFPAMRAMKLSPLAAIRNE